MRAAGGGARGHRSRAAADPRADDAMAGSSGRQVAGPPVRRGRQRTVTLESRNMAIVRAASAARPLNTVLEDRHLSSPTVQVLGAYKVEPTAELLAQAMEWKYGGVSLSSGERRLAEQHVRDELARVVLVEVLVGGRDERFSVADFGQAASDQAPYGEVFLSEDGGTVIAQAYDVPSGPTLRAAFFLHHVDPGKELTTSYGAVKLPPLQSVPQRLAELVPYEPVA